MKRGEFIKKTMSKISKQLRNHLDYDELADLDFIDSFMSSYNKLSIPGRAHIGAECYNRIQKLNHKAKMLNQKMQERREIILNKPSKEDRQNLESYLRTTFNPVRAKQIMVMFVDRGKTIDESDYRLETMLDVMVKLPIYKRLQFWRISKNQEELYRLRNRKAGQFRDAIEAVNTYSKKVRAYNNAIKDNSLDFEKVRAICALNNAMDSEKFKYWHDLEQENNRLYSNTRYKQANMER